MDVHEGREQWPKMETCIEAGKGGVKMPEFCERLLRMARKPYKYSTHVDMSSSLHGDP